MSNRLLLFVIVLLLGGCASKRHLEGTTTEGAWRAVGNSERMQYINAIGESALQYTGLQARAKGYLTVNDRENHEVSVQIRMKKDEVIWISATGMLGMEAGRVMITPDSIALINRLESAFIKESYDAGSRWLGDQLSFNELQQLLIGNAPDREGLEGTQFSVNSAGGGYFTMPNGVHQIFEAASRLTWWKGDVLEARHAYESPSGHASFPSKSTLTLAGPQLKLILTLDYSRLDLDQDVNFPFSIPKGYRQIH